jgi:hypothetical protein
VDKKEYGVEYLARLNREVTEGMKAVSVKMTIACNEAVKAMNKFGIIAEREYKRRKNG